MRFGYSDDDLVQDQVVAGPARAGGAPPAVLVQRRWVYGPHARVQAVHDARRGTTSYRHDVMGRLVEEARHGDRVASLRSSPHYPAPGAPESKGWQEPGGA